MDTLKAWAAKGLNISVTGKSSVDGSEEKVTKVRSIEPRRGGRVVAVLSDGTERDLEIG